MQTKRIYNKKSRSVGNKKNKRTRRLKGGGGMNVLHPKKNMQIHSLMNTLIN
jgi:hypothetical protein